jgi:hypothetical protein
LNPSENIRHLAIDTQINLNLKYPNCLMVKQLNPTFHHLAAQNSRVLQLQAPILVVSESVGTQIIQSSWMTSGGFLKEGYLFYHPL